MHGNSEMDKLVMVPGPTPVHRDILSAISEPTIWHSSAEMARIVSRCAAGILSVAGAADAQAFIFGGAGTLAQEAAVVNLVAPGERMLVVSNGYFGDRFAAIGEAFGIHVDRLAAEWGTAVTADELLTKLQQSEYRAVTITHVDTSTGTAAPVRDLTQVASRDGAFVILDSVCGLGGMPVDMSSAGIDVVLSGAQKALGVPPGLALLAVSRRAMERRREMGRISAFYSDLLNWEMSMQSPQTYFSTHAVNLFYALASGLDIVEREGLAARVDRHHRLARAFRAGIEALGFRLMTNRTSLASTLSVVAYPDGVQDEPFRAALNNAGVVAAPTIGEWKGRGLRFGHMGNISDADILRTLGAAESALMASGAHAEPGCAVGASQRELSREVAVLNR